MMARKTNGPLMMPPCADGAQLPQKAAQVRSAPASICMRNGAPVRIRGKVLDHLLCSVQRAAWGRPGRRMRCSNLRGESIVQRPKNRFVAHAIKILADAIDN